METKHTPGPWIYNDTTAQVHPPHSAAIAEVYDHDMNREANARLIVAAPELLAALQKAVARQGFSNDELLSARAAIANALGSNASITGAALLRPAPKARS